MQVVAGAVPPAVFSLLEMTSQQVSRDYIAADDGTEFMSPR